MSVQVFLRGTKSIGKDAPVVVITGTGKFSGTCFAGATGVTENHVFEQQKIVEIFQ